VARWDSHRIWRIYAEWRPNSRCYEALEATATSCSRRLRRKDTSCMGDETNLAMTIRLLLNLGPNEAITWWHRSSVGSAVAGEYCIAFHLLEHGYSTPKGLGTKSNDRRRSRRETRIVDVLRLGTWCVDANWRRPTRVLLRVSRYSLACWRGNFRAAQVGRRFSPRAKGLSAHLDGIVTQEFRRTTETIRILRRPGCHPPHQ